MEAVKQYRVKGKLAEAESRVRDALKAQGFGILTEVDVQATLKTKLGIDTSPYKILGACNPPIAHRALEADPSVGAFLPCGVALKESADGAETIVFLQNPRAISEVFANPALKEPGEQAASALEAALSSVAES